MRLVSDAERRNTLVALPEPVDQRLDLLIRVVRTDGIVVSRSQMLAAMVAAAPTARRGRLSGMVRRYLALTQSAFSAEDPNGELPEVARRGRQRRQQS
jgi:hypothetical protein